MVFVTGIEGDAVGIGRDREDRRVYDLHEQQRLIEGDCVSLHRVNELDVGRWEEIFLFHVR